MEAEELFRSGRVAAQEPWLSLSCGLLTVAFDPASASLRYLRVAGREVVRAIYVAVRDCNWDTIAPVLSKVNLHTGEKGFTLTFDATCRERDIDFVWRGEIVGDSDRSVTFRMDGQAYSTFLRNRIGFCVLHPVRECAGQPCLVEKVDGSTEAGVFPQEISPHQPFLNMRSLSQEVMPGLRAEICFEGDIFEMEDQRNWTDASYKTYCTPLALPYPVEIQAGTCLRQSVTLTLNGRPRPPRKPAEQNVVVLNYKGASTARRLPSIGLSMTSEDHWLTDKEIERLQALNLAHLRADVRMADTDQTYDYWARQMRGALMESITRLRVKLECAIHLMGDKTVARTDLMNLWYKELHSSRWGVARALIYHEGEKSTSGPWLDLVREVFSRTGRLHIPLFGGTNAYFAELNRQPPPLASLDGVCWSVNPQVHAFDNASLVENLEGQAWTIRSARALFGRKRLVVSPVTLKPRFNPNLMAVTPRPEGELPDSVDTRQMSLFGAGWTLGSLKMLAENGAESVTYFETVGWRGVMEREQGSPLPERFPSLPGAVFPLYHVLADVGDFHGGKVWLTQSSNPLTVEILALERERNLAFLIANLTSETQTLRLMLPPTFSAQGMRQLDTTNVEWAMREPEQYRQQARQVWTARNGVIEHELPPYAVLRLDGEER